MTTRPHGKITVRVEVDLDDQARAELVALGWTPPGENDRIAERVGIRLAPTPDPNDICACGHRFRGHLAGGMTCGHCSTCRGFVAVDTSPDTEPWQLVRRECRIQGHPDSDPDSDDSVGRCKCGQFLFPHDDDGRAYLEGATVDPYAGAPPYTRRP